MDLIENLSQLAANKPHKGHESLGQPRRMPLTAEQFGDGSSLQQHVWHGQKLEALGQLAVGVAHNFNNLLTVILGCSEMLIHQLPADDPRRELAAEIHKAGSQAERLTRQILGFGSPRAIDPQVLDVGEAIRQAEKMLRRMIGAAISFTTNVPAGLWHVKADPGQLQQIIVNLVLNARDAMPDGGRLTIEAANFTRAEAEYVMISFTDTGIGISPAVRPRIFEPFFTTKAPGKGTGLGLAMVDDIVKRNGGRVLVESELGQGSAFRIFLPHAQDSFPMQTARADEIAMPAGREVVLLVEDDDAVRHLTRQVLQLCGYTVLEANDGREAAELAEKLEPIDLLLSDVMLPHLGGCQLAEQARRRHPQLKVLFLSGHSAEIVVEQGGRGENFAFLQKPFTMSALARKVREVLDQPQGKKP